MDTPGVEKIEAVADRGYFKIEDIEACEANGITAYVPEPIRGPTVAHGFLSKEEFRYDLDKDIYLCPGRPCALAASLRQVTRQREDRLHQTSRLQGAPSARALHQKSPPCLPVGERGRSRPHGSATCRATRHPRQTGVIVSSISSARSGNG